MTKHSFQITRRQWSQWALMLAVTSAHSAPAQIVTIRNAQLRVTKELRAWSEVAEFHKYWSTKKPVTLSPGTEPDWAFTLDIVGGGKAERWQYQSNGMATRVGMTVETVYQIKNPKALNELIGALRF